MKLGRFDTNADALQQRIQCHEKYGSNDLNQWIFDHLELTKGLSIVDLGCGTGKQTLPLAQIIGDTGRILAVDISQEALDTCSQSAKKLGIEKRISLLHVGLDDLGKHLHEQVFDRALGSYSLYYAQYPRTVSELVHRVLKPGGILFFCGPAKDNNFELKQFHYGLRGEQPPSEGGGAVFMEETGQQLSRELFTKVEIFIFQNPLRFNSADALYSYWSSYNLYDDTLDVDFKSAATKYFQTHSVFETHKRVIGVKAIK
jgi:SAM-dependent methyltransferase